MFHSIDSPFAGTGSVLTSDETIEMDALIMDGTTLGVGAVACVSDVKHPVQLARTVMEKVIRIWLYSFLVSRCCIITG